MPNFNQVTQYLLTLVLWRLKFYQVGSFLVTLTLGRFWPSQNQISTYPRFATANFTKSENIYLPSLSTAINIGGNPYNIAHTYLPSLSADFHQVRKYLLTLVLGPPDFHEVKIRFLVTLILRLPIFIGVTPYIYSVYLLTLILTARFHQVRKYLVTLVRPL